MLSDTPSLRRIHIGNISPKLAQNAESFTARLGKFGSVKSELDIRSKPVNDFHYGFIDMEISDEQFKKLKSSLNGILFMGLKLTVDLAKDDYQTRWLQDSKRADSMKFQREQRERISHARDLRIKESKTKYAVNSITGELISHSLYIGANNSSAGYTKSAHTPNNLSGNTKHKPPTHDLKGEDSYGAKSFSKQVHHQQFSNTSGHSEVIQGCHRSTPRPLNPAKDHQTLRILVNNDLKQFKAFKTKLWGVDQTKTSKDLTYRYANGVWKSGDEHIVERVAPKQSRVMINDPVINGPSAVECGIDGDGAMAYGKDNASANAEESDEDENLKHEREKNSAIVASLFSNHDFDKAVEIEDDIGIDKGDITYDSKGRRTVKRYDYETAGVVDAPSDVSDAESFDYSTVKSTIEKFKESSERPPEARYYDEDDEGNDLDMDELSKKYTTEAINDDYNVEHGIEVDHTKVEENKGLNEEDSEEELVPSFGEKATPVNDTETLRGLFNPGQVQQKDNEETSTGFKLALSEEDDIDYEKEDINAAQQEELLQQIKSKQQEQEHIEMKALKAARFGLFWHHFDSPFLQTQSQLNKVGTFEENAKLPGEEDGNLADNNDDNDESPYEKWFWEKRGELSRECKRRKRDVSRIFKKKASKATV